MKIRYILIIIFLLETFAQAQVINKIDSLMNEIKTSKNDTNAVKLYLDLGSLYERSLPDTAIVYFKKALLISEQIESKKFIAKCKNQIGNVFLDQGNYDKAVEYFLQSLKIFEELEDKTGICKCYNNIGIVYWYQSAYDKAIEYFQKSLKIYEELEDKNGMAKCYNNIGMVYSEQKNFSKSLEYYFKSLKFWEELKAEKEMSACYVNIGIDYKLQGNYDKGLEYYKKSFKIKKELGDKKGLAIVYVNMAELNIGLKANVKAINQAMKGLDIAKEINALALQKYAYEILFTANDSLHNYQDAYKYLHLYKQINDSIYNENSSKRINEMLTKYGTEKKEKDNELLSKDNEIKRLALEKQTTLRNFLISFSAFVILLVVFVFYRLYLRKKANRILTEKNELITKQKIELSNTLTQLHKLNATKDKFFSIIGHDLRQPFQAVIGFSELLKIEKSEFYTDKMKKIVDRIYNAGKDASNLLNNLLEWSQTQTGTIEFKPERILLRTLFDSEMNILIISSSKKGVSITVNFPGSMEVFADKNMIKTVIRNLVSNAIKFTPSDGSIQVYSQKKGEFIETTISDTGVGIDPEIIDKVFDIGIKTSTKGTENETGSGLGLALCKEFIERNDGKIRVESILGKGSCFIFTLLCAAKHEEGV